MGTLKQSKEYRIIGDSQGIRDVFDIVEKAANSDSTVMVFGESGTGKELIARALHQNSERKDKPFIAVNCAAIPENLVEAGILPSDSPYRSRLGVSVVGDLAYDVGFGSASSAKLWSCPSKDSYVECSNNVTPLPSDCSSY